MLCPLKLSAFEAILAHEILNSLNLELLRQIRVEILCILCILDRALS